MERTMNTSHKLNDLFNQTEKLLAQLKEEGAPEIEELRERLDRSMAKTKMALKNKPPKENVKVRDVAASFNHYVQHYPWMALATGVLVASTIGILATNATKRSLHH
jgi:ElaB/YqjD/DUF883 family membrane-anchored ribosome-binding protein